MNSFLITFSYFGICISTHTPLAGRDLRIMQICLKCRKFQLTRPSRGATQTVPFPCGTMKFQLTRPSRGATFAFCKLTKRFFISTHTPLAGRDCMTAHYTSNQHHFNSHAPRGARLGNSISFKTQTDFNSHAPRGARRMSQKILACGGRFQLTRPSRGATAV